MISFLEERAKGGVGLITIGDGIVDTPIGNNVKESLSIDNDQYIPRLKKLSEAVKKDGARVAIQLSHGGRRAGRVSKEGYLTITKGRIPVAPSSLPHPLPGQVVPKELSREEIKEIVEKFGQSSRRAIESGFDAIGLHCAHMYLCGQFLSPLANHRTDEYGCGLEGRLRFVLEVIERIKRETGKSHPLIVRMNGEEQEGGNSSQEIQEIARRLQQVGIDAIHVSVGFGAPTKTRGFIPSVSPMRAPAGCIVHLAENIKRAISIPVIAVNKLGDILFAEKVLQKGSADLIGLGRPLIADPYLPLKAIKGKLEDIRPCISCCVGCVGSVLEKDAPIACSVNPMAGREIESRIKPAKKKKKVLVVGAGPSGVQAALTATERGHRVHIVEKEYHIGGQLFIASRPPGKGAIETFRAYLEDQVRKSVIQMEVGKEISASWLDEIKPDIAILAMGSEPIIPEIEGSSKKRILTARDILMAHEIKEKRILVLGGGQIGCEVAEYLAGRSKKVTIIEILDDIAQDMERINRLPLIMSLEDQGVRIMTKTKLELITEHGAWVNYLGKKELLQVDGVVIAVGAKPHQDDVEMLIEDKVPEVYRIGDKVKAGAILEAVRDGFDVGNTI
jgi:2,4-dienoyl-CoA reductase-like NADH-dependent reductase (Old Yellow Enzyme family)/thioredoxin reductase